MHSSLASFKGELQPQISFCLPTNLFERGKWEKSQNKKRTGTAKRAPRYCSHSRSAPCIPRRDTPPSACVTERLTSQTRWPGKASFSCTQKRLPGSKKIWLSMFVRLSSHIAILRHWGAMRVLSQPWAANVAVVATQEAPIPTLCLLSVSRTEQSRIGPQDKELRRGTGSFPCPVKRGSFRRGRWRRNRRPWSVDTSKSDWGAIDRCVCGECCAMRMPRQCVPTNSDYQLKINADYRLKWWWNEKANYRLKWKYRLLIENETVVPVYFTIRLPVRLSDYWLEMKGIVERPCDQRVCWKFCTLLELGDPAGWSAFCAAKDIENIVPDFLTIWLSVCLSDYRMKMSTIDWRQKCRSCLPFLSIRTIWPSVCLSDYQLNWKLPTNDWHCRSCPPFMSYRKLPTNDWNCRSCQPFICLTVPVNSRVLRCVCQSISILVRKGAFPG